MKGAGVAASAFVCPCVGVVHRHLSVPLAVMAIQPKTWLILLFVVMFALTGYPTDLWVVALAWWPVGPTNLMDGMLA